MKYKEEIEKRKTSFDKVKTPQGALGALILGALILPKIGKISSWTCYCCKKTTNK
jgi:hypothetical protein